MMKTSMKLGRRATLAKEADSELECSVCLEEFSDPRCLVCSHTYCLGCLQGLLKEDCRQRYIICPQCREWTMLRSSRAVSDLPRPLFLRRFTELRDKLRREMTTHDDVCELCAARDGRAPAQWSCKTCDLRFCDACRAVHDGNAAFSSHVTSIFSPDLVCDLHGGRSLSVYCADCELCLCPVCVLDSHDPRHMTQALESPYSPASSHSLDTGAFTEGPDEGPDEGLEGPDEGLEGPDEGLEGPDEVLEGPNEGLELSDQCEASSSSHHSGPDSGHATQTAKAPALRSSVSDLIAPKEIRENSEKGIESGQVGHGPVVQTLETYEGVNKPAGGEKQLHEGKTRMSGHQIPVMEPAGDKQRIVNKTDQQSGTTYGQPFTSLPRDQGQSLSSLRAGGEHQVLHQSSANTSTSNTYVSRATIDLNTTTSNKIESLDPSSDILLRHASRAAAGQKELTSDISPRLASQAAAGQRDPSSAILLRHASQAAAGQKTTGCLQAIGSYQKGKPASSKTSTTITRQPRGENTPSQTTIYLGNPDGPAVSPSSPAIKSQPSTSTSTTLIKSPAADLCVHLHDIRTSASVSPDLCHQLHETRTSASVSLDLCHQLHETRTSASVSLDLCHQLHETRTSASVPLNLCHQLHETRTSASVPLAQQPVPSNDTDTEGSWDEEFIDCDASGNPIVSTASTTDTTMIHDVTHGPVAEHSIGDPSDKYIEIYSANTSHGNKRTRGTNKTVIPVTNCTSQLGEYTSSVERQDTTDAGSEDSYYEDSVTSVAECGDTSSELNECIPRVNNVCDLHENCTTTTAIVAETSTLKPLSESAKITKNSDDRREEYVEFECDAEGHPIEGHGTAVPNIPATGQMEDASLISDIENSNFSRVNEFTRERSRTTDASLYSGHEWVDDLFDLAPPRSHSVMRVCRIRPLGVVNDLSFDLDLRLVVTTTSMLEPVQIYNYQGDKVGIFGGGQGGRDLGARLGEGLTGRGWGERLSRGPGEQLSAGRGVRGLDGEQDRLNVYPPQGPSPGWVRMMGPHGVAVDGEGRIAVVDRMAKSLLVFDPEGIPVTRLRPEAFKAPLYVTGVGEGGVLAVSDRVARSVHLCDPRTGAVVRSLAAGEGYAVGPKGVSEGWVPGEIAYTQTPRPAIYVRDTKHDTVSVLGLGGELWASWGGECALPRQFTPRGVGVAMGGHPLVTDWAHRVVYQRANKVWQRFYSLLGVGRPYLVTMTTGLMALGVAKKHDGDIVEDADIEVYSVKLNSP